VYTRALSGEAAECHRGQESNEKPREPAQGLQEDLHLSPPSPARDGLGCRWVARRSSKDDLGPIGAVVDLRPTGFRFLRRLDELQAAIARLNQDKPGEGMTFSCCS
jgi:hypothetical protein